MKKISRIVNIQFLSCNFFFKCNKDRAISGTHVVWPWLNSFIHCAVNGNYQAMKKRKEKNTMRTSRYCAKMSHQNPYPFGWRREAQFQFLERDWQVFRIVRCVLSYLKLVQKQNWAFIPWNYLNHSFSHSQSRQYPTVPHSEVSVGNLFGLFSLSYNCG